MFWILLRLDQLIPKSFITVLSQELISYRVFKMTEWLIFRDATMSTDLSQRFIIFSALLRRARFCVPIVSHVRRRITRTFEQECQMQQTHAENVGSKILGKIWTIRVFEIDEQNNSNNR